MTFVELVAQIQDTLDRQSRLVGTGKVTPYDAANMIAGSTDVYVTQFLEHDESSLYVSVEQA